MMNWFHEVADSLARVTVFYVSQVEVRSWSGRNAAPCQAFCNRLLAMTLVLVEADAKLKKLFNMDSPESTSE